jgi:lysophospholipase L1-like esterase
MFAIGLNDSARKGVEGEYIVPIESFIQNVETLITKAKVKVSAVYIVGLTNVDESRTAPLPDSSTEKVFLNENVKKYNVALRDISSKSSVSFIDVFGILDDKDLADGLHPNANGYQKMFETISKYITS